MTDKLKVDLSGAPQTMLATFYAKALDARLPNPILGDDMAADIAERIDYDWARTSITPARAPSVTTRSVHFDRWARQFLAVHSEAIVLHLGCGLDGRFFRLDPGPGVEWYDVDYPEVIALRSQLFGERERNHLVAASVTDPAWLAEVPTGRPVLMLGEGLTMYLTETEGVALLRRVVDRFGTGELQFDAYNSFGIRTQWSNTVVRRSGATLRWAINEPDDILRAVPRTRLLTWMSVFEDPAFGELRWYYRLLAKTMRMAPPLRYMAQYHRYAF